MLAQVTCIHRDNNKKHTNTNNVGKTAKILNDRAGGDCSSRWALKCLSITTNVNLTITQHLKSWLTDVTKV